MTNRFRFDLENGREVIPDETGIVADDVDVAIEEAVRVVGEMREGGEFLECGDHWELVIRDDDGGELKRIPL